MHKSSYYTGSDLLVALYDYWVIYFRLQPSYFITKLHKRVLLEAFVMLFWGHDGGQEELKVANGLLHSDIKRAQ